MKPEDLELHDARLQSMVASYSEKTVILSIEVYPDVNAKNRVSAEIHFFGVERLSDVSDFVSLAGNRSAGNIAYWNPASGYGTTNVYLADGFLAITAQSVKVLLEASRF